VEHWFQNTRGIVIIVLAVITGVVLLAVEPGDGFPVGSGGGTSTADTEVAIVTTAPTTVPQSTTTTAAARPQLQEGSTGADVTVLQQRLNALGYSVGNADGSFGPGTKAAVVQFQTAKGISPANGVVDTKTWTALLANPTPSSSSSSTAPTTTTVKK
jgi:peptidoglycan hydrolase-like protein with peptidoglycan-binding domain